MGTALGLTFESRPLTPGTWADLESLFDLPGGSIVRGCWCMFYRRSGNVAVNSVAAPENKRRLCELVDAGVVPGLVGYVDGAPAGWISLGPRKDYAKLQRSPIMKPVDDRDVWSVVCTYVARRYRGQGIQHRLLKAAIRFAREQEVRILEAYPVDKSARSHDDFMFFGSRSLYERAGFTEVARRSPTRVVMRRNLRPARKPKATPAAVGPAPGPTPGADPLRLRELRNLGPASERMLVAAGIHTPDELDRLGAVEAYQRAIAAGGRRSLNFLWSLDAALLDVNWSDLPSDRKELLRHQVEH